MTIVVNGTPRQVSRGTTVLELLRSMAIHGERGVAVARNGDVVLRAHWSDITVEEGDRLEVLTAVQGG